MINKYSQQHQIMDNIVLRFSRKSIKQESYVKFLGMLLNSNLSWKIHLTKLSKKLARTAGLFYRIRHYAPEDTRLLLFSLMVFLHQAKLLPPISITS